eukprot:4592144-Pleurochrysis_carterae.AAC.2
MPKNARGQPTVDYAAKKSASCGQQSSVKSWRGEGRPLLCQPWGPAPAAPVAAAGHYGDVDSESTYLLIEHQYHTIFPHRIIYRGHERSLAAGAGPTDTATLAIAIKRNQVFDQDENKDFSQLAREAIETTLLLHSYIDLHRSGPVPRCPSLRGRGGRQHLSLEALANVGAESQGARSALSGTHGSASSRGVCVRARVCDGGGVDEAAADAGEYGSDALAMRVAASRAVAPRITGNACPVRGRGAIGGAISSLAVAGGGDGGFAACACVRSLRLARRGASARVSSFIVARLRAADGAAAGRDDEAAAVHLGGRGGARANGGGRGGSRAASAGDIARAERLGRRPHHRDAVARKVSGQPARRALGRRARAASRARARLARRGRRLPRHSLRLVAARHRARAASRRRWHLRRLDR